MPKPLNPEFATAWPPIADALAGLEYGAVEIVVHNGRIVQIERREKFRLDSPARSAAPGSRASDPD